MTSVDGNNCLACGEPTLKRARVSAATVSLLLKKYLSVRCQENSWELDLDTVIGSSFVCKSCSKVYLKHLKKNERLYEATSASASVQQSNSETRATRKRLASQESVLHGATKRQCIIQDSASKSISPEYPPIVGIGYKSGYRSYPVTSPT
uniref:Uncharacterized protein n=1 Tax=Amphimedon queenslandica TaxID=400682 RepID=A0A1X7V1C2_AMPQE